MDRKGTTDFLKELLIKERFGNRTYWSSEVSLDYGTRNVRRVDFVQFQPAGVLHVSDIEKGIFICYEIKSSVVYPCRAGRRSRSITELLFCMLRSGQ